MAAESFSKVYISVPTPFLKQMDRLARSEHMSRSALIREAVKLYMHQRASRQATERFFRKSESLREGFADLSEPELGDRIDGAVQEVRRRRHAG